MAPSKGPVFRGSLLLDTRVVSSSMNTRLVLGQVTKCDANPLFGEDYFADPPRRWEARFDNMYPTVIYDSEMARYRAWYFSFSFDGPLQNTPLHDRSRAEYRSADRDEVLLYAESEDGITWDKPSLGLIEFEGSTDNNIVMASWTHGIHADGVLHDPHDPDPGRRFKLLFRSARDRRMAVAFSTDGLDWGRTVVWPENDAVGDTHNNAVWSHELERYVGITRGWTESPYHGERTVLRTESHDFVHWTQPVEVARGASLHDQIYSMPIAPVGDAFIGLPAVFHKGDPDAPDWDTVDTELAWSPDSREWHRIRPGEALIPRGASAYPDGEADAGCIYAAPPIVDPTGNIRLYYGGSNGLHNGWREGSLNLAVLGANRYAGLTPTPDASRATVRTSPVVVGRELTINVQPRGDGHVRVALVHVDGTPVPGFGHADCEPITGDDVSAPVRWASRSESDLPNTPVRLDFELSNVTLYAVSAQRAKG